VLPQVLPDGRALLSAPGTHWCTVSNNPASKREKPIDPAQRLVR